MENEEKERLAKNLAAKAEKALKILKITVIATAVCAVILPAVSLILVVTTKRAVYMAGMFVALALFVAMLCGLAFVIVYVRLCLKKLKALDEIEDTQEQICSASEKE